MKWLIQQWYAHLRRIDMKVLWPECLKQAESLDAAKAAFALHAYNDSAWRVLGEAGIYAAIDQLKEKK